MSPGRTYGSSIHPVTNTLGTAGRWVVKPLIGETSKFPHTNHKKPSVSLLTLAPTTICDLSHGICRSPLTDLGHIYIIAVTYVCHPLWFVCGHRKGILMSPLSLLQRLGYNHISDALEYILIWYRREHHEIVCC